jgi:Tol biopolymer transport system component
MYPSWGPTSTKIALGNTSYYFTEIDKTKKDTTVVQVRRISIYSNFEGEVQKKPLHSEKYLDQWVKEKYGEQYSAKDVSEGLAGCAWSPDGKLIAFTTEIGYFLTNSITIANADGTIIKLVEGGIGAFLPTFSPDSKEIYYLQFNSNYQTGIHKMDINGENIKEITPYGRYGAVESEK